MVEEEKQPTILPGNLFRRTESTEKRIRPEVETRKVDVVAEKRRKQNKWDQYMRKFEYVKALDAVIAVCLNVLLLLLITMMKGKIDYP